MTDAGTPGSSSDSAPSAVVTFVTALPDGSFGIGGGSELRPLSSRFGDATSSGLG